MEKGDDRIRLMHHRLMTWSGLVAGMDREAQSAFMGSQ